MLSGSQRWRLLPLADVRVLAIEQFGAGPWGTLQLADLGAEVIKIEDPASRGDVGRYVPPFQEGESSLFFETFNRNKRSISLDLKSDEGRAAFEKLVAVSDMRPVAPGTPVISLGTSGTVYAVSARRRASSCRAGTAWRR